MPSNTLTPRQRLALGGARRALAAGDARHETGEQPGNDSYWMGRYRAALQSIAAAFPEDDAS